MKNTIFLKVIAHLSCFFGILIITSIPKNKYEWMLQIDPTLHTLPNDESEGARLIVSSLVLAYVLGVQLFMFVRTSGGLWRLLSLILVIAAAGVWSSKWL